MAKDDPLNDRYEKRLERKRRKESVVSDNDAPVPDAPIKQARSGSAPGRNDPCPCGSGKKYKKCCGKPG